MMKTVHGNISPKTTYTQLTIKGKKIDEHRHVMQLHLGRKLKRDEIVHHKDGNKKNNSVDNLQVMSQSQHIKVHFFDKK